MQTLFIVSLGVGAGYTILSLIMGNLLDIGDPEGGNALSPLRPAPLAAFLTVFGGVGTLYYTRFGLVITLILAAALGVLTSYLLIRFILMPLHKAQNTSTIEQQSLIGQKATVAEKIFENGYGKISYHINGSNFSSPAKSENGQEISAKTTVEIVYIEKNTYYVRPRESV